MRAWMLLCLLTVVGCTGGPERKCGNRYLLLWPNAQGTEYGFQEIEISTLNSPYSVSGPAAKVYFESTFGANGFQGEPAAPRLTSSDGLCVPEDVDSGTVLSLYAQMERLMDFDTQMGIRGWIPWPRSIGLKTRVSESGNIGHNNAHYFSESDVTAYVPYTLNGLPLASNHGVVAHEHFHSYFDYLVLRKLSSPGSFARGPDLSIEDMNGLVLRGWNEGLADLYAALYAGNPHFFAGSLDRSALARNLNGELYLLMASEQLRELVRKPDASYPNLVANSYAQGTIVARLLYQLVDQEGLVMRKPRLALILHNLRDLAAWVNPAMRARVLNFDEIVPLLLRDWELNEAQCSMLGKVVSKRTWLERGSSGCTL